MTGTFKSVDWNSVSSMVSNMKEAWEWIEKTEGLPAFVEMTLAPADDDWSVITVIGEDEVVLNGLISAHDNVNFRIEAGAFDVIPEQLVHRLFHSIEDMDIPFTVNGDVHCDCHKSPKE
ncbi:MAG: hypothetical protein IJ856_07205 [Candidatus Methanomethylophilaceae archaeon]|nr:hypothetical protein [Candidatus Methanomethylophilaceae archaeon]